MKRIYTIIAAIAATSPILSATEISADSVSVDTVKVIEGAHRMVLTESLTGMTVTVSGMDNDSLYSYSYHKDFAPMPLLPLTSIATIGNLHYHSATRKSAKNIHRTLSPLVAWLSAA